MRTLHRALGTPREMDGGPSDHERGAEGVAVLVENFRDTQDKVECEQDTAETA